MAKKTLFRLEFEPEYRVLGVFCREKDYRFGWLLNNNLGFNFASTPDFAFIPSKSNEVYYYSVYSYRKEELRQTFFLVNNHSHIGMPIFKKPPGLDFLLLVKADDSRFNFTGLLKNLRSIPQVTAAYMLDDVLGSTKDTFLYDFEVYVAQEMKL